MNHPTWKPATIPARDPVDPKALPPIEWTSSGPSDGLVVTDLSPEDLTTEQRVALGLEDA